MVAMGKFELKIESWHDIDAFVLKIGTLCIKRWAEEALYYDNVEASKWFIDRLLTHRERIRFTGRTGGDNQGSSGAPMSEKQASTGDKTGFTGGSLPRAHGM